MNNTNLNPPELLAPAGDFNKMRVAFLYGADAVYIGAKSFGLRSASGNFTMKEIEEAIVYAHQRRKKIYLVVNTLPHNDEVDDLIEFMHKIKNYKLDALIISDAGVLSLARKYTEFEIHLSTQASSVNYESALFWKDSGVSRIILGRETSLNEAYEIYDKSGLELEIFIHGSMCMSYSGKCTISNYVSLRDANRGGCTHSCRWEYFFTDDKTKPVYPLNSRDLWAIDLIPEIVSSNKIASLKIEGRMKNHLYLANTISTYRKAIDICYDKQQKNQSPKTEYEKRLAQFKNELRSNVNRTFMHGFLKHKAGKESILYDNQEKQSFYINVGSIIQQLSGREFVVEIRNPLRVGETIEFCLPDKPNPKRKIKTLCDITGDNVDIIPNNRIGRVLTDEPLINDVQEMIVIRKPLVSNYKEVQTNNDC